MLIAQQPLHPELDGPDYFVFDGTGIAADGQWVDRRVLGSDEIGTSTDPTGALIQMMPTGKFETRADTAVAEIWRPQNST